MSDPNICKQRGVCSKLFFVNLNENEFELGKFSMIFDDVEVTNNFSEASKCEANEIVRRFIKKCPARMTKPDLNRACIALTDSQLHCEESFHNLHTIRETRADVSHVAARESAAVAVFKGT